MSHVTWGLYRVARWAQWEAFLEAVGLEGPPLR